MSSPVLDLVKSLLVTDNEDPFGSDISLCLGVVWDGPKARQCDTSVSHERGRAVANYLMSGFRLRDEVPRHDLFFFYRDVEKFIECSHCASHAVRPLVNFEIWKQKQSSTSPCPSMPRTSSAADTTSATSESETKAAATPTRSGPSLSDVPDQDSLAISPADTLSPGLRNEFRFSRVSLATTAITTPGSLRSDERTGCLTSVGALLDDAEVQPETPTRGPRNVKPSAIDLCLPSPSDLADSFRRLNLAQEKIPGPKALDSMRGHNVRTSVIDLTVPSPSDLPSTLASGGALLDDAEVRPETPTRGNVKPSAIDLTIPSASNLTKSLRRLNLAQKKIPGPKALNSMRGRNVRTSIIDSSVPHPSELANVFRLLKLAQSIIAGPEVLGHLLPPPPTTFEERLRDFKKAILSPFGVVKDEQEGKVYLWEHKENPLILKIGFTKHDSKKRGSQPGNHAKRVTKVRWESAVNFRGAFRVEKIVHSQLVQQKIHFICNYRAGKKGEKKGYCKIRHKEWFEWEASKARELLNQWTRFVQMAYDSAGMITGAARRLVEEMVHDLQPNLPQLLASLEAAVADKTVHAEAQRPLLVRETGRAGWVAGRLGKRVNFLRSDEDDVFAAEPDTESLSSDGESLSGTAPRDGAAALAFIGPQSRRNSWKDKAQSTRHFFSSLKRAAQVPSSSGGTRRSHGKEEEAQRVQRSTLQQLDSELRIVEDRTETNDRD